MRFDVGVTNGRAILELTRDPKLHRVMALLLALGAAMAPYLLVKWHSPEVIRIDAAGLVATCGLAALSVLAGAAQTTAA